MPVAPKDTVDDLEDEAEDQYESARSAVDEYVTNNPIAAIAISLGLGIVIGRFLL